MDRTDKQILEILQTNSKLNNQDLADKVSLSPSPCLRRVKQLEEEGYIKQYVALLDQEKIGLQLTIWISIGLNNHDPKLMNNFEKDVESFPEVTECYLLAGQSQDYMLKIVTTNLDDYHSFLMNKLTQIDGVKSVTSSFVLKNIINKTSLPLDHLK